MIAIQALNMPAGNSGPPEPSLENESIAPITYTHLQRLT